MNYSDSPTVRIRPKSSDRSNLCRRRAIYTRPAEGDGACCRTGGLARDFRGRPGLGWRFRTLHCRKKWGNRVSLRGLVIILGLVTASATAYAQTDYSAGKTPAQLFSGDCSVCHKSARGLAKNRDARSLASFLREHYTSKAESAGALASYLLGNPGPATDPRRQGATPVEGAAPQPGQSPRQPARGRKPDPAELAREAKAAEEAAKAKLRAYAATGEAARPLVTDAPPAPAAVTPPPAEAAPTAPAAQAPSTSESATPSAAGETPKPETPKSEVGAAPAETHPPAERPSSTPPG